MSEGKYPFEDTPAVGESFSKVQSGKTIEDEKPIKKVDEEETYDTPKPVYAMELVPGGVSVPSNAISLYDESKSTAKSETHAHAKEDRKSHDTDIFTDNPIKSDVPLNDDFEKVTVVSNDMESEA